MGVQCDTANLGLAALTYATVDIVNEVLPGEAEIVLFSINSDAALARMSEQLGVHDKRLIAVPFYRKRPASMINSFRQMRRCDVIVDFTGGDSFADIYGTKRIAKKLGDKQMALASRVPFVLAPQTIGPFRHKLVLPWAKHVINRAALVFTRDELSRSFLSELTERDVIVATDVAVRLPWTPSRFELAPTDRPRVGVNVSGLLWNGGYTGQNQFDLRTDYQAYCHRLLEELEAEGFEIHLVPHVISRQNAENEDDAAASRKLAESHPGCVIAPPFESPVEAKSYISHMDVFVGSRMHATIASFTSGVPTVPVAYSRKFAGFFGHLGYSPLVDLTTLDTEPAVVATMASVLKRHELADDVSAGIASANERIEPFVSGLASILSRSLERQSSAG